MLIASMNPSPSGEFFDPDGDNANTEMEVKRYLNKISGPLLDRIDLHVEVSPIAFDELSSRQSAENSAAIRERVIRAREVQKKRFEGEEGIFTNAQLSPKQIKEFCELDKVSETILKRAMEKLNLSARSYARILKVSRTIADLSATENIKAEHIAEAIQYRSLDREGWLS
jgi:magnesium chelatase family protein